MRLQTRDPRPKAKNPGLVRSLFFVCSLWSLVCGLWSVVCLSGCTVKAVGDPNRPITIQAHVIVDIRGLKETATNIEDFVSGEKEELKTKSGETR